MLGLFRPSVSIAAVHDATSPSSNSTCGFSAYGFPLRASLFVMIFDLPSLLDGEQKPTLFRSLSVLRGCAGGKSAFRPYFIGAKRVFWLLRGGLRVAPCGQPHKRSQNEPQKTCDSVLQAERLSGLFRSHQNRARHCRRSHRFGVSTVAEHLAETPFGSWRRYIPLHAVSLLVRPPRRRRSTQQGKGVHRSVEQGDCRRIGIIMRSKGNEHVSIPHRVRTAADCSALIQGHSPFDHICRLRSGIHGDTRFSTVFAGRNANPTHPCASCARTQPYANRRLAQSVAVLRNQGHEPLCKTRWK